MTSYRAEVIADSSGKWAGNGLTFATDAEALAYVADLSMRWTAVRQVHTISGDWPVTHRWNRDTNKAEALS